MITARRMRWFREIWQPAYEAGRSLRIAWPHYVSRGRIRAASPRAYWERKIALKAYRAGQRARGLEALAYVHRRWDELERAAEEGRSAGKNFGGMS